MKMKSVVLAAATAVASSAFAQIFDKGDVYAEWFTSNATTFVEFDTELASPSIVTNLEADPADGYAVTAVVAIVVHSGLPGGPEEYDDRTPKGAICAAVVESVTNWYGLAKLDEDVEWVALTGVNLPTPTEGTENAHTLVMEFKDKDDAQKVRYSIDGVYATYTNGVYVANGWLGSGSDAAPKYVAFAGSGHHKDVKGLRVYEKAAPSVSTSSWAEGYDFTNGTVTVTLDSYKQAAMGDVRLVVKDYAGNQVGSVMFNSDSATQSITPTLQAGNAYTYSIVQTLDGVVTTNDVGTFVAAAPGVGFSASAESGSSVVTNGTWSNVLGIESSAYAISGDEVFNIAEDTLETNKLVIVDNRVTFTSWGDDDDLQDFDDGTFAAITAVTNSSGTVVWKAYKGPENGWLDLVGGVTPAELNAPYDIRATFDFSETNPKMAFAMKASGDSVFIPFAYNNNAWITSTVATNVLSEVGYSGMGKLASVVGNNYDAKVAAIGDRTYATLADAIAAATNGSDTVTLRTNTQWPGAGAAGRYTILTNGFVLAGITTGSEIAVAENGYVITLSAGICAVEGGKLNVDETSLSAIIGGSASGKTPEEITAALTAKADNGVEKWVNYVLGIDGSVAANKPFAAPVQNAEAGQLTFALGGVGNIPAGTDATVAYEVETSTDGSTWSSGSTAAPGNTVTVDAPADSVKYYRVKVRITLPD